MSVHIGAKEGQIAESVLMPGDPLRAKFIAENFLTDIECYNNIRGMYGFTGNYKGKKVSVQGSGMGMPSLSIYANELIQFYGVKNIIRVGTCGGYSKDVKLRDVIIAMAASTDSNINRIRFKDCNFAPVASFKLLKKAYDAAIGKGIDPKVGNIFSSDTFYGDDKESWKLWANYGCLGVEMEAAALYTLAAKFNIDALAILTVSDHFIYDEITTAEEREKTFTGMIEIALETVNNI